MPIPGDNGNPMKEKEDGEKRITNVADTGAYVQKELKMNKMAPKEKCIFGDM